MPTRPKQHELEDLSRVKFQLSLPRSWVFRDKDKDYGIDGEVELFDSNGNSQGLLFYVQLKATSSNKKSDILNVDFKLKSLEYFKNLEIPVLLARYCEQYDIFYTKWINDVDIYFAKEKSKTFRVKITEDEKWTDKTTIQIENDLKNSRALKYGFFNFPLSYSIIFSDSKIQALSNIQFKAQLRSKLSEYPDFLSFEGTGENSLIKISVKNNVLLVQSSILNGVYYHNLDKRPLENFITDLSLDILLGLSMCMVMLGKIDYCGKIIFENNLNKRLIEREELLLRILPALLSSSYFENTLKLVSNALDNNEREIILFPTIATLLLRSDTNNKKKTELIESFFQSQLEKSETLGLDSLKATAHYNLGNFYRGRGSYYQSIYHYVKAKKYDVNYLNRPYYYQEVAGLCFESEKFRFSFKFYEKSIHLGAPIITKSLFADALMFAGEYEKAYRVFDEYIIETEQPNEEFLLKAILLKKIILQTTKSQDRNPKKADIFADITELDSKEAQIKSLEKAFSFDLLSSTAWFNLGHINLEENNFLNATYSFAMCAIVHLSDIESWTFAFLSFINSGREIDHIIGSLILQTAYLHNRDKFLEKLYLILEENLQSNNEIISLIDDIIVNSRNVKNKSIVGSPNLVQP